MRQCEFMYFIEVGIIVIIVIHAIRHHFGYRGANLSQTCGHCIQVRKYFVAIPFSLSMKSMQYGAG